tara:strand:- start:5686 stop:6315 length:630 start_codon:yes stop_codon:yes gene_type:complete
LAQFDYSENLLSANQKIVFNHEWSNKSVEFKAFDISYSETIVNDWEEVNLPRRINRSYTWNNVTRNISLSWGIPAFDVTEAKNNLAKCSAIVRMMYPMTNKDRRITGGNPIWHLGIMNWVHHENVESAGTEANTMLAGFPNQFSFDIVHADGYLYEEGKQNPYPVNIKASLGYTVLLDDSANFGWSETAPSKWQGPASFPWSNTDDVFK